MWGKTYQGNEDGVSAAIAFTDKGDELLHQCNCTLVKHPFDVVAEGQMKTCPEKPLVYRLNIALLMDIVSLSCAKRIISLMKKVNNKFKNIIGR